MMKMEIIKNKFEECKNDGAYKRINSEHPLDIYLGFNDKHQKCLVIIANSHYKQIESSKMITVTLSLRTDNKYSLCFALNEDNMSDIFYQFCSDIIDKTNNLKNYDPILFIVERWKQWIQMFKNPGSLILPENEVRGLLGELIFLNEYMFPKYGISKSLISWEGSSLSHKDYEIDNTWYEIKTVKENALTVDISSVEQLQSDIDGKLVIYRLEPSNISVNETILLNKYVKVIEKKLIDLNYFALFTKKLEQRRYFYSEEYDKYIYSKKGVNFYLVNDDFPKITKDELKDGIARVSYQLYIDKLKKYIEVGE